MTQSPENIISKLRLIGIEAQFDYSASKPILVTESPDIDVIKEVASLEGFDLTTEHSFGETSSLSVNSIRSFAEIAAEEDFPDDSYEDEDDSNEEMTDEDEEKLPNRFADKSSSIPGELRILTDASQHKAALNWYNALGNESMAKYPAFLAGLDAFLSQYAAPESKSKKSEDEEASFLNELEEIASLEIAKGKKKKSARQEFLSALMTIISGDAGENIIRQWREGRFDKFTGSMIKVAKSLVEKSPSFEGASDDGMSQEETTPVSENKTEDKIDMKKDAVLVAEEYIKSLSPEEVTEFIAMCHAKKKA